MGTFDDYEDWFAEDCDSQRFANDTDDVIFFKPESDQTVGNMTYEGGHAYPLMPGAWTDVAIDGFCYGSTVVKVTDGYSTCGVSNGSYTTHHPNVLESLVNLVIGGEKDDSWLQDHRGEGWEALFDRRQ